MSFLSGVHSYMNRILELEDRCKDSINETDQKMIRSWISLLQSSDSLSRSEKEVVSILAQKLTPLSQQEIHKVWQAFAHVGLFQILSRKRPDLLPEELHEICSYSFPFLGIKMNEKEITSILLSIADLPKTARHTICLDAFAFSKETGLSSTKVIQLFGKISHNLPGFILSSLSFLLRLHELDLDCKMSVLEALSRASEGTREGVFREAVSFCQKANLDLFSLAHIIDLLSSLSTEEGENLCVLSLSFIHDVGGFSYKQYIISVLEILTYTPLHRREKVCEEALIAIATFDVKDEDQKVAILRALSKMPKQEIELFGRALLFIQKGSIEGRKKVDVLCAFASSNPSDWEEIEKRALLLHQETKMDPVYALQVFSGLSIQEIDAYHPILVLNIQHLRVDQKQEFLQILSSVPPLERQDICQKTISFISRAAVWEEEMQIALSRLFSQTEKDKREVLYKQLLVFLQDLPEKMKVQIISFLSEDYMRPYLRDIEWILTFIKKSGFHPSFIISVLESLTSGRSNPALYKAAIPVIKTIKQQDEKLRAFQVLLELQSKYDSLDSIIILCLPLLAKVSSVDGIGEILTLASNIPYDEREEIVCWTCEFLEGEVTDSTIISLIQKISDIPPERRRYICEQVTREAEGMSIEEKMHLLHMYYYRAAAPGA